MNKKKLYYLVQRLIGLLFVVLATVPSVILEGDLTAALLIGSFGLWMMFTKKKVRSIIKTSKGGYYARTKNLCCN